uniref:RRM domain-containing protein n=1 Tax=Ditylenchus dipsaci TaxID=166011 RepID=A0A915DRI3_9BILA
MQVEMRTENKRKVSLTISVAANHLERLFKMPVGSSCYADFSKSINLRFVNPEDASKIPSIRKIFENHAIKPKQSSIQEKNQLCSSGIVIFSTVEEAVKALILCNHAPIVEPYQKNSYIFQLRFA